MLPVKTSICFGTLLVITIVSPSLISAETKPDLGAIDHFIDDERPTLHSQALYVALPKGSRGGYLEHGSKNRQQVQTSENPVSALIEQRIREIFAIRADPKPLPSNTDDERHVFKVQRNPDGKLSVVFNDTLITPHYGPDDDADESPGNNNNRHSQSVRDIVFPTEKPINHLSGLHPKCSEKNQHFCTEVENYPADLLASIITAEPRRYEQLFGDDILPPPSINLTQRIDVPGEESLCQSSERIVYPKAGINKDDVWSIIVNHDNFTQGIRIEECINTGSQCALADSFPLGYKTECKQKYIYRQLLSLSPGGQVIKDLFKLPSCCKCIVTSNHRFRRGTSSDNLKNQSGT